MLSDPAGILLKLLTPAAIVAVGVGSLVLFGQKPKPSSPLAGDSRVLVETEAVEDFGGAFTLRLDGVALPHRRIKLGAEVEGRITEKSPHARGGRHVEPGMPLFEIDATDYALGVERLQAQARQSTEELAAVDVDIANTEALLTLAVEDQALAKRQLERATDLNSRNAISETELDEASRQELASRNSLQSLRNQLSTLKQKRRTQQAATELVNVQLKQAQADLARTKIVAPISASVVTDHVEIDDHVRPGDVLIELSDNSQMEIRCSLTIDQLFWIWLAGDTIAPQGVNARFESATATTRPSGASPQVRQSAPLLPNLSSGLPDSAPKRSGSTPGLLQLSQSERIEIPPLRVLIVYEFAGQTVEWDGILSRFEGAGLDAQTRTAPCRVLVKEPTRARVRASSSGPAAAIPPPRIFSGMYVDIEIPILTRAPLLKLPLDAVRPGEAAGSGREVWVVRDGKLSIVNVEVARIEPDYALIYARKSGLRAADRVIVSPLASVSDGLQVREAVDDPFDESASGNAPRKTATGAGRTNSSAPQSAPLAEGDRR